MENYQTRVNAAKEDAVKALKDEFQGYNGFEGSMNNQAVWRWSVTE